jgi:hypothetical protein
MGPLGLSAGLCLSGYDAISNLMLVVWELVAAGGDWGALSYRPDLFGGLKLRDAVGPFPPFALLARLGLSATSVYNVSAWLVQGLLAFLGTRTADDLTAVWSAGRRRLGWAERLAAIVLIGFAPALGWRFGYGHLTLVTGMLPFAAGISLVAAFGAGTATCTLALVALVAQYVGLLFTGHQIIVYGATLGVPILLGVWHCLGRRPRALAWPAIISLGALLLALPSFGGVLAYAMSSDSPRSLGHMGLTYAYATERWIDWLGSLAWTRQAIPTGQGEWLHHESNVPLGPLLLMLALVPWRRAWALGVGLALSLTMIVVLSANVEPLSTALLALVRPLNSFRVPMRSALLLAFSLPVLVLGASGARDAERSPRALVIGALAFALTFLAPSLPREALGWGFALTALLAGSSWPRFPRGTRLVVVLALAGGSLGAFRERLLPFVDVGELSTRCRRLGDAIGTARPEIGSPLTRVSLGIDFPELGPNTAFAARLSSLDAYSFPPRRFGQLYWALRKQDYEPSAVLLRTPPGAPWAPTLFQLFNVAWRVDPSPDGKLALRPLPATAGPAWFSGSVRRTPSMATLASELVAEGPQLYQRAHEVLWVVEDDVRLPAVLPRAFDAACTSAARVVRLDAARARPWVAVTYTSPADCPLTLAMNYAETLRAEIRSGGETLSPAVFPAYGTLAAMIVPKGSGSLRVEAP